MNVLLALTGSVATIKAKELTEKLPGNVKIIATDNAVKFLPKGMMALTDHDEWSNIGDSILHIELRKWADVLVVAPMSANTMAKFALGLCDNLVTSVYRAWDHTKPVVLCPAMNTYMWDNDPTNEYISILKEVCHVISPISKKLACGDVGVGAMARVDDIVEQVVKHDTWCKPVDSPFIPLDAHPGAYGVRRKHDFHSGVDLYCKDGDSVRACEDGVIVHHGYFTGPSVGHPWWEETYAIQVQGRSGVITYGEIYPRCVEKGNKVLRGSEIGRVKRVLPENKLRFDIPYHSTSMLHLELYKHGHIGFGGWNFEYKDPDLLDPTPHLLKIRGWENV